MKDRDKENEINKIFTISASAELKSRTSNKDKDKDRDRDLKPKSHNSKAERNNAPSLPDINQYQFSNNIFLFQNNHITISPNSNIGKINKEEKYTPLNINELILLRTLKDDQFNLKQSKTLLDKTINKVYESDNKIIKINSEKLDKNGKY